jgi:hypothetical protein
MTAWRFRWTNEWGMEAALVSPTGHHLVFTPSSGPDMRAGEDGPHQGRTTGTGRGTPTDAHISGQSTATNSGTHTVGRSPHPSRSPTPTRAPLIATVFPPPRGHPPLNPLAPAFQAHLGSPTQASEGVVEYIEGILNGMNASVGSPTQPTQIYGAAPSDTHPPPRAGAGPGRERGADQ